MIRTFTMEDLDYIIEAHIRIYHLEYQFDESFDRFISDAVHSFRENMNCLNEMVFILELDGRPKGSIGITRLRDDAAQLRWFLLEKEARGRGWGRKLIEEASALELPFENGKHICVLGIK